MPNFAIVNDGTIVNLIVAESQEIAEQVTGFPALATDGTPGIGWTLESGGWRSPSPFPSWEWNGEIWQPPLPYPDGGNGYTWDEETVSWLPIPEADHAPAPEE